MTVVVLTSESSRIITWWNRYIKSECDKQDLRTLNGIPSYCNVWDSPGKSTLELHRLISSNHNEILNEVNGLVSNSSTDYVPIRLGEEWTLFADKVPTLSSIAMLFPEIINLQIAIFQPGSTIVEESSNNRMIHRYHYGLKVPRNDIGLKIAGFDVKWEEKEGFVWDNTLPHSIWNHTTETRIVIFVDILRELSTLNSIGSKLVHSLTR